MTAISPIVASMATVDQELLARNEYLTAENRILKARLNGRLKLSDAARDTGICWHAATEGQLHAD